MIKRFKEETDVHGWIRKTNDAATIVRFVCGGMSHGEQILEDVRAKRQEARVQSARRPIRGHDDDIAVLNPEQWVFGQVEDIIGDRWHCIVAVGPTTFSEATIGFDGLVVTVHLDMEKAVCQITYESSYTWILQN